MTKLSVVFSSQSSPCQQMHKLVVDVGFPWLEWVIGDARGESACRGIAMVHAVMVSSVSLPLWKLQAIGDDVAHAFLDAEAQTFIGQIMNDYGSKSFGGGDSASSFEGAYNRYMDVVEEILPVLSDGIDAAFKEGLNKALESVFSGRMMRAAKRFGSFGS